ncbi:hypothetical protein VCM39_12365 [Bacteroides sp. CG01]|uniref:hypothetical protein n=1 Tax=Bacteroides sp. CG01 TaxID=3096000 RepID=UPI002AFEDE0E|nr:hypothetical protein [Bacteroides sp. CG01]
MAIINRVYSPLRTQLSMDVAEGTLTQEYDANNKIYTPDRRIRPTAILPVCGITDTSEIIESGIVNRYITDVKWYENGIKDVNLISPTSIHYKIDYSSETNNRGRITVYKNVNSDSPITLFFTANYADIVNGKVRRKVSFLGSVILSSSISASSPIVLKTETLRGTRYNPLSELKYMTLSADLYSGNTIIPAAYWWYKKENGQNNLITDYVGHNLRELQVPSASLKIGTLNNYLCKVQDCRQDLTEVRNGYLQENLDKISGYPRNLLAKQYFLDLNDEINPGVVTEGEDADGKYICIPNPAALYAYVGQGKYGDLFGGKISFKENTVYVIRVSGKYINQMGLTLNMMYTDGSKSNHFKIGDTNKKMEYVIKSDIGKTISHISCTYIAVAISYIYDIQITEDYNYNLLEGDTEEVTVNPSDSNTNYASMPISPKISSKKVTVGIDDVVNIAGDATEYSVSMYNYGTVNSIVADFIVLSKSRKTGVLNLTDKYDASQPAIIMLYAGRSGSTASNSVKYNNVQLLEGEYAWNVLGEDIEEVIIEAGENSNAYKTIKVKEKLTVGGKYTASFDEIVNISGEATEYAVTVSQEGKILASGIVTKDNHTLTLTINDKYDPNTENVIILVYAGRGNNTAGNTVKFTNIRLLQGETVLPSMPAYTPHFIPSAPDIEVESESIQLPEGYRPDVQGKTFDHEFALTSEMPAYNVKVVTPYGDDSGVISIPNNVKLFPAWIQVDVAGIGTLDNPGRYFSADWGNGLKGMNVLLDADDIGMGIQEVEPDVVEGLEYVKYAASGIFLLVDNLEDFVEGSRIVVEVPPNTPNSNAYISTRKNGVGLLILYNPNGNVSLFIYGYNKRMSTIIKYVESVIQRYELRIGATLEECQLFLNGKLYTGTFGDIENGGGDSFIVDADSRASLIEIYSPENVLLHKWDFKGSSNDEIFSDKADTENKINFIKGGEYELIPV